MTGAPFPTFFPFELAAAAVREQEFARLAAADRPRRGGSDRPGDRAPRAGSD